jgi:hypothetical protein
VGSTGAGEQTGTASVVFHGPLMVRLAARANPARAGTGMRVPAQSSQDRATNRAVGGAITRRSTPGGGPALPRVGAVHQHGLGEGVAEEMGAQPAGGVQPGRGGQIRALNRPFAIQVRYSVPGRAGAIRTLDPLNPIQVRYQTAPQPEVFSKRAVRHARTQSIAPAHDTLKCTIAAARMQPRRRVPACFANRP